MRTRRTPNTDTFHAVFMRVTYHFPALLRILLAIFQITLNQYQRQGQSFFWYSTQNYQTSYHKTLFDGRLMKDKML